MLKFMAWERSFEARVLKVREKELKYQKKNYIIEVSICNIKYLSSLTTLLRNIGPVELYLVRGFPANICRMGSDITQECRSHRCHACVILALCHYSTSGAHAFRGVHFGM
jgi:hypothetical protein